MKPIFEKQEAEILSGDGGENQPRGILNVDGLLKRSPAMITPLMETKPDDEDQH